MDQLVILMLINVVVVGLYIIFRPSVFTQGDLNHMMNKRMKKGYFVIR